MRETIAIVILMVSMFLGGMSLEAFIQAREASADRALPAGDRLTAESRKNPRTDPERDRMPLRSRWKRLPG